MRFYANGYEVFSEVLRDLDEMGLIVKPKSYQNKNIEGNSDFHTKELMMYNYALTALPDMENLFLFEGAVSKNWAELEFFERISKTAKNPGEAWKLRKDVWEEFLNENGQFDYSYQARINEHDQLEAIIKELQRNPDSRQLWLPIFQSSDTQFFGGKRRIPCSLGYYIMVRENKVFLHYIQRSADAVRHWGNDIYLAWQMKQYITNRLEMEQGHLYHTIFSLHSYRRDWGLLKKGISNLANYNQMK